MESLGGGGACFLFGLAGALGAVAAGFPESAEVVGWSEDTAQMMVIRNKRKEAANARSPRCWRANAELFFKNPRNCTAGGDTASERNQTRGSGFVGS